MSAHSNSSGPTAPSPWRSRWPVALACFAGMLAGCSSADESDTPAPARGGVYSEMDDFADAEQNLDTLAAHKLELVRVLSPADFGSTALRSLIESSAASAVPFRAWLVLPADQGYWPGESNLDAFGQAVDDFLAWVQADALPVDWITFDMEPDQAFSEAMMAIAQDRDNPNRTSDLVDLLRSHLDPAAFAAHTAELAAIVDRVHQAGLRAHAVTYPLVLDDHADGDTDIQDSFDTPIDGIDWDEVTFMVYRSVMQDLGGGPVATSLFYSYGVDARASYGERAGLDFGLVGQGVLSTAGGYQQPAELYADVAAARAAGIDRVRLYSFEGARGTPDPDAWLSFAATPPGGIPEGGEDPQPFRVQFALLDTVLPSG